MFGLWPMEKTIISYIFFQVSLPTDLVSEDIIPLNKRKKAQMLTAGRDRLSCSNRTSWSGDGQCTNTKLFKNKCRI